MYSNRLFRITVGVVNLTREELYDTVLRQVLSMRKHRQQDGDRAGADKAGKIYMRIVALKKTDKNLEEEVA